MITIQAITRGGQNLQARLRLAIREGHIKSFEVSQVKGGLRIRHKKHLGNVALEHRNGLTFATLSCKNKEREWQLLEAFVGRLVYHFKADIAAINIQLGVDS
jgi:hypothetical protein